eukprot:scaffold76996_cov67-Attheya_sp.AAC.4
MSDPRTYNAIIVAIEAQYKKHATSVWATCDGIKFSMEASGDDITPKNILQWMDGWMDACMHACMATT